MERVRAGFLAQVKHLVRSRRRDRRDAPIEVVHERNSRFAGSCLMQKAVAALNLNLCNSGRFRRSGRSLRTTPLERAILQTRLDRTVRLVARVLR